MNMFVYFTFDLRFNALNWALESNLVEFVCRHHFISPISFQLMNMIVAIFHLWNTLRAPHQRFRLLSLPIHLFSLFLLIFIACSQQMSELQKDFQHINIQFFTTSILHYLLHLFLIMLSVFPQLIIYLTFVPFSASHQWQTEHANAIIKTENIESTKAATEWNKKCEKPANISTGSSHVHYMISETRHAFSAWFHLCADVFVCQEKEKFLCKWIFVGFPLRRRWLIILLASKHVANAHIKIVYSMFRTIGENQE